MTEPPGQFAAHAQKALFFFAGFLKINFRGFFFYSACSLSGSLFFSAGFLKIIFRGFFLFSLLSFRSIFLFRGLFENNFPRIFFIQLALFQEHFSFSRAF
jgi:hypothetical protein